MTACDVVDFAPLHTTLADNIYYRGLPNEGTVEWTLERDQVHAIISTSTYFFGGIPYRFLAGMAKVYPHYQLDEVVIAYEMENFDENFQCKSCEAQIWRRRSR